MGPFILYKLSHIYRFLVNFPPIFNTGKYKCLLLIVNIIKLVRFYVTANIYQQDCKDTLQLLSQEIYGLKITRFILFLPSTCESLYISSPYSYSYGMVNKEKCDLLLSRSNNNIKKY